MGNKIDFIDLTDDNGCECTIKAGQMFMSSRSGTPFPYILTRVIDTDVWALIGLVSGQCVLAGSDQDVKEILRMLGAKDVASSFTRFTVMLADVASGKVKFDDKDLDSDDD